MNDASKYHVYASCEYRVVPLQASRRLESTKEPEHVGASATDLVSWLLNFEILTFCRVVRRGRGPS